jgi:hypothetical protein
MQVDEAGRYNIIKGASSMQINEFLSDVIRMKVTWSLVNKLFRRSLYSENIVYPTDYMGEDMALCLQLLSACNKVSYVENTYYFYMANFSSESRSEDKRSIIRLYDMFSRNFNIVLNHYIQLGLCNKFNNDLLYTCFNCKLIFAKRAKSISIIKRNLEIIPRTPIDVAKDKSLSLLSRFQAFFFYLLNI